jgi:hypothetical protein
MTDNLFHEIPDAQVILRSKGVFKQAKLFRRGEDVYAAWGSGFIRLLKHSGTTVPAVSWMVDSLYDPARHIITLNGLPRAL